MANQVAIVQDLSRWIDTFANAISKATIKNSKAVVQEFYAAFPEAKEPQIGRSDEGVGFTFHLESDAVLGEVVENTFELVRVSDESTIAVELPDGIGDLINFLRSTEGVTRN